MLVTDKLLRELAEGKVKENARERLANEAEAELQSKLTFRDLHYTGKNEVMHLLDLMAIATIRSYFTDYTEYDRHAAEICLDMGRDFVFIPRPCGSYLTWPDGTAVEDDCREGYGVKSGIYHYFRTPRPAEGVRFMTVDATTGHISLSLDTADALMARQPKTVIMRTYTSVHWSLVFRTEEQKPWLAAKDFDPLTEKSEESMAFDSKGDAIAFIESIFYKEYGARPASYS